MKPELRTSLVVAEWPREVRYFWVLLWGYLDDHGRGVDDARLVKADCLPLDDDVTRATVEGWLEIITAAGPLCRYEVAGRKYLHAPNWPEHQRPSHPTDSRIPVCPVHDRDGGAPESLAKSSGDAPETLAPEQVVRGVVRGVVRAGSREQGPVRRRATESPRERGTRGTRIPDDFAVTDDMKAWAATNTPTADLNRETDKFRDYWHGKSGTAGIKDDWIATWRNWMRNAVDFASNAPQGSPKSAHQPHIDKPQADFYGDL